MRAIVSGADRRQQLSGDGSLHFEQSKELTAFPLPIPNTASPALKPGALMAKPGTARLIPDKDFCLDDFLDKQDTGFVSGSESQKEQ